MHEHLAHGIERTVAVVEDRAVQQLTTVVAEEKVEGAMSSPLPPGTYYFHLRTRDNWGNWSAGVHVGPYIVQGGPALRQWWAC